MYITDPVSFVLFFCERLLTYMYITVILWRVDSVMV